LRLKFELHKAQGYQTLINEALKEYSELPLPLKGQGFRYLLEAEASRFLFFFYASLSLPASRWLNWSYLDSTSDTRLAASNPVPG
jgi:hypothetical protein